MSDINEIVSEVVVKHERGLHLRCAGNLVKIASGFKSRIKLSKGRKSVNIISALDIIALSASPGTKLNVTIKGEDAQAAMEAVIDFFNNPDE